MDFSDTDISNRFPFENVESNELAAILQNYFKQGQVLSSNEVIFFENDPSAYGVLLNYENDHIKAIRGGTGLNNRILDSLLEKIHSTLIADLGSVIGSTILFNYYPTDGYFRYKDVFQLRPVPRDAPRPKGIAPDYPSVLEFRYNDSPDNIIRHLRIGRVVYPRSVLYEIHNKAFS